MLHVKSGTGKMKPRLLVVTNEFNRGGIGMYLRKVLPLLADQYELSVVSRDPISVEDQSTYRVTKCFTVKLPKILDFWPVKEVIFFSSGVGFFRHKKFEMILCNYAFYIPRSALKEARVIQVFHSLHEQYVHARTPKSLFFMILKSIHLLLILIDKYRVKISHRIIFVSKSGFDAVDAQNKYYIPNPVGNELEPRHARRGDLTKVLIVCRQDPFKGVDFLRQVLDFLIVQHFEKYRDLEFSIVGLEEPREPYRNAKFLGLLDFNESRSVFEKSDIFLSFSYLENMPNTLFEALNAGCIPLVSAVGDCERILGNDRLLFEPNNLDDFIGKFDFLLSHRSTIDLESCLTEINREYALADCVSKLIAVLAD
jgi:hypothetical protein